MRLRLLALWQWFRELGQPQAELEDDREGFYERNADKFGLPQHGVEEKNQQGDVRAWQPNLSPQNTSSTDEP